MSSTMKRKFGGGPLGMSALAGLFAFALLGADTGCVTAARGPITPKASAATGAAPAAVAAAPLARVGKPAPDFEATAFVQGKGFAKIQLSQFKGKWVILCFYPGDFTFV
jgi:peroxiredoxin (alkyl hydroperoxide reductase subunit C)